MPNIQRLSAELLQWYKKQARNLPWRETYDPYYVWLSEVMLQQTTMKVVVPYFKRFISAFPTVQDLAAAEESEVLENWAGLGYYSRAKNLLKAAQFLKKDFPKSHQDLITLPGFGPYTSRAVSSIAFQEAVGVVDGNVIRVLSRINDSKWQWWKPAERDKIQSLADNLAIASQNPRDLNQSLMELGATVCTPQSPICNECPVFQFCLAQKNKTIKSRPLKKPKEKKSIWLWQPELILKNEKIFLVKQAHIPFLKNQMLPPGKAKQLKTKPKKYGFKHSITTYEIFVDPKIVKPTNQNKKNLNWFEIKSIKKINPSSVIQKLLHHQLKGEK